jgi:hypothetical protein
MMTRRIVSAVVAAILGGLLATVPANADTAISRPFKADSGDACRYGTTEGTLNWLFGPGTNPLPVTAVDVRGTLTDHPTPADPASTCHSDGFASTATFSGLSGSAVVARQQVRADNAIVAFQFRLAPSTTGQHVDRVVIQVCRGPVLTLPPSYCGTAVTYLPPPVG